MLCSPPDLVEIENLRILFCGVFLKAIFKYCKASGVDVIHYRLVESYRVNGTVRHETMLNLGTLDELPELKLKKELAARVDELVLSYVTGRKTMFTHWDEKVEQLAKKFSSQIIVNRGLKSKKTEDFHTIDTMTVENKDVRESGAEWMCYQTLEQLGINSLLKQKQWDDSSIQLAFTHIISRAVYPASELKTSCWIRENSSVCEITGYPLELITKDKLYGISHKLMSIKDDLEKHLSKKTNELFDLDDKIILYDLTNTYYEGVMPHSRIARFGRSKEKRNDARLVVLAVVVNVEGFLKYSQIFEGNLSDVASLQRIIAALSKAVSPQTTKPTIVMDAGISSEDNLKLLRQWGYHYICVARGGMHKYRVDSQSEPITVTDLKGQPIDLQRVQVEGSSDNYILAKSHAKVLKEQSIESRFTQRFEQSLEQLSKGLDKKGGVKQYEKIWERIGRIKQKYCRVSHLYHVTIEQNDRARVTKISWTKKTTENNIGQYLLRTDLNYQDEKVQWSIYNTIREIEATFRTLKTDLDLRPIYHKSDAASIAHLHLGLLAYWVVNTIRYQLKQKGINSHWKEIVRIMNTQKLVTTTMTDHLEQPVVIRKYSEPTDKVASIYQCLNYKDRPYTCKKFVVPQNKKPRGKPPDFKESNRL